MIYAIILNIFKNIIHAASYSLLLERLLGDGKEFSCLHLLLILLVSKLVQLLSLAVDGSLGPIGAITHRQDVSTTSYLMHKQLPHLCMQPRFPQFLKLLCCSPGAEDVAVVILCSVLMLALF